MARIFWVKCPACESEFYCHYGDFRHSKEKLLCPSCGERFQVSESLEIRE